MRMRENASFCDWDIKGMFVRFGWYDYTIQLAFCTDWLSPNDGAALCYRAFPITPPQGIRVSRDPDET
jgi:hypothetical protein